MTQEQKAKAYDEVREKIAIRFGSNVADEIFSRFEMSEDEKVRKKIINYFQCQSEEEPTRKEIHNKWIAWLEKQGEQKPINDTNDEISEELKAASILHSELVRNQSCIDEDFIDGALWLKRQIAWSEEDEKRIERIYRRIWAYRKGDTDEIYQIEQDANWLKSIKDRLK